MYLKPFKFVADCEIQKGQIPLSNFLPPAVLHATNRGQTLQKSNYLDQPHSCKSSKAHLLLVGCSCWGIPNCHSKVREEARPTVRRPTTLASQLLKLCLFLFVSFDRWGGVLIFGSSLENLSFDVFKWLCISSWAFLSNTLGFSASLHFVALWRFDDMDILPCGLACRPLCQLLFCCGPQWWPQGLLYLPKDYSSSWFYSPSLRAEFLFNGLCTWKCMECTLNPSNL